MPDSEQTRESQMIYEKESHESQGKIGHIDDIEAAQSFGTEIVNNQTGRAALRPKPSSDPNDPLVLPTRTTSQNSLS